MPDTFHFKFPDRKRMIHIPASFKHSKVSRKKKKEPSTRGLKEQVSLKNTDAAPLKKKKKNSINSCNV